MKLTDKKIKYIIREKIKRRSSTEIAKEMKISTRYVNYIYKKYKENGEYIINNKRKPKIITDNEIDIVKNIKIKYPLSGPERIRKYLKKINIIISKNTIYKILLSLNTVNEDKNKKKQRKYVKYERSNSNSLWHIE